MTLHIINNNIESIVCQAIGDVLIILYSLFTFLLSSDSLCYSPPYMRPGKTSDTSLGKMVRLFILVSTCAVRYVANLMAALSPPEYSWGTLSTPTCDQLWWRLSEPRSRLFSGTGFYSPPSRSLQAPFTAFTEFCLINCLYRYSHRSTIITSSRNKSIWLH